MTLKESDFENFKNQFEKVVSETISEELLTPEISIDAAIDFSTITDKFFRILKQFEPFGPENMTPLFLSKKLKDTGFGKSIGADNEHLKLFVKQNDSQGFAAIGFGLGSKIALTQNNQLFQAVYSIDENQWNGQTTLQLRLRDLKEL